MKYLKAVVMCQFLGLHRWSEWESFTYNHLVEPGQRVKTRRCARCFLTEDRYENGRRARWQ
jgi:hypothetical protein